MKELLDRTTLKRFLKLAGDRLTGEWVLIGGTVLPALGVEHRSTVDIDLIGLTDSERVQSLALMELAEELGLPVESINQAGDFFLQRIANFKRHLIPLYRGKTATIHRPDATLFVKLKIGRLSESDLQDILEFLKLATASGEAWDRKSLLILVRQEQRKATSDARAERLRALSEAL